MSDGQERREYPNPPIEEALCQVTFAEKLAWSVATPGLLFEALRKEYPQEPQAQDQIQASLQIQGESQGPSFALNRGSQRFVYKDETGKRLILVSPETLSVNSLRPYEGWPNLRNRFQQALELLGSVLEMKPVAKVGLRYINRIVMPLAADTDDYFDIVVRTAEQNAATFVNFMHRVESVLSDMQTRVVSTFATLQESTPDAQQILLDYDFTRENLSTTDIQELLDIADDLKLKENREFESSIKDKARELFK